MIYAPKTPKAFFDDALLYGTLIKYVGEKAAKKLNTVYRLSLKEAEGEDISATFGEVFHPDFTDPAYAKVLNTEKAQGRKTAKIDSEFNYDSFFEALSAISQIKQTAITKKELKEIERLATLYGIDEVNIASIVANLYEPTFEKGKRIDFKKMSEILHDEMNYAFLSKRTRRGVVSSISADTDLANLINLMERKTPREFLSVLQNGTKPAEPDLRLVDSLSEQFHLNNGVINALISFVLETNGNILPKALCQKIAASLARENITTALDAMDFLKKIYKKQEKKVSTKAKTTTHPTDTEQSSAEPVEEEIDWDELMSQMED
jgi:replication initiation and membrane attachment protein